MNHFYKNIINDFIKNYNCDFDLHDSDYINRSIQLSGDYINWKNSIPTEIIFGLNGNIIFNNDSIFIEKSEISFKYIDLNLMNNTIFLDYFFSNTILII
jgi:hypothetical protein